MAADLFEHAVNQAEGAMGEAALPGLRLGPDGEEFGGEVALSGGLEIQMAAAQRAGLVPVFVDEALWRVSVGVDDQR
jgi:hypothetical protein